MTVYEFSFSEAQVTGKLADKAGLRPVLLLFHANEADTISEIDSKCCQGLQSNNTFMNGNTEGFEQKKRYLHWKQKGQISLEIKQLNELAQFCKNKVL